MKELVLTCHKYQVQVSPSYNVILLIRARTLLKYTMQEYLAVV